MDGTIESEVAPGMPAPTNGLLFQKMGDRVGNMCRRAYSTGFGYAAEVEGKASQLRVQLPRHTAGQYEVIPGSCIAKYIPGLVYWHSEKGMNAHDPSEWRYEDPNCLFIPITELPTNEEWIRGTFGVELIGKCTIENLDDLVDDFHHLCR